MDWTTGLAVDRQLVTDAAALPSREPEGMAIRLPGPTQSNRAQLCFGFASGITGARTATVCHRDVLV